MDATNPAADLQARFRPTDQQVAIARAMLTAEPLAEAVYVGLALPGKQRGLWTTGQAVRPVPGFWLSDGGQIGPYAAWSARDAAETAAQDRLTGRGVAAYASIYRNGTWSVFEGLNVDPANRRPPVNA